MNREQASDRRRATGGRDATLTIRKGPDGGRRVDARELFGGEREVSIVHGDQAYRLRLTASGKLILTK